ncbi:MAG: DUF5658 family protein [Gammaproteobacteria bacterium]|nr:DUF5658 family protein [Gammaproteobacteria bacterium]
MEATSRLSESPTANNAGQRRREGACRRRTPIQDTDWRWAYKGRRRGPRRNGEQTTGSSVDAYPPSLIAVVIATFCLSALDATLTLELIRRGIAVEGNPLLDWLLQTGGPQLFVNVKTACTGGCLVFLAAFAYERVFNGWRVKTLLYWLLGSYCVLIGYEILMLTQ